MKMRNLFHTLMLLGLAASAHAGTVEYYVAIDSRQTVPSGTYAGLADPNYNRLSVLFNHGDHFHAKGVYTYTGPNQGDQTQVVVSPSNYVPEGLGEPIALLPGSGVFAGLNISGLTPGVEFSDITFNAFDALAGFPAGSDESILFNSSGGRWNAPTAAVNLTIELVDATAGLTVRDAAGNVILGNGLTSYALGAANAGFNWTPIFAASGTGDYQATFRLVDTGTGNNGNPFGSSGEFQFRFNAAVPEPGSIVLSAIGGLTLAGVAARNRARNRRSA